MKQTGGLMDDFDERNREFVARMGGDEAVRRATREWFEATYRYEYSYHFTWLGRPVIQYPQDVLAVQEIVWRTRPELIVETGIARGGSLILSASLLELIGGDGRVVGIDIDIREHNRVEIERHPLAKRIEMIQGSSVDEGVFRRVARLAEGRRRVLVMLDSNHTHEHVRRELDLYSRLVGAGGYLIVFDTVVEEMPAEFSGARPWGPGDNPLTAVREFLRENDRFEVDREIDDKLLITAAPGGYLRCVRD
ncbi:MAG: cephalosporin hydroxylase family protein [Acidobacteria bacterium]|nr:cephalosporin hydroxylase family protein [Acidobacteriota bacterium]